MAPEAPDPAGRRCICRSRYCLRPAGPQVWVSQAEIKQPTLKEVESLELNINQLINAQVPVTAFASFDKKALYGDFVNSFNSFNNKRQFLMENGYLDVEAAQSGVTDAKGKRLLLKKMTEGSAPKRWTSRVKM